jgi:hypothetical protein
MKAPPFKSRQKQSSLLLLLLLEVISCCGGWIWSQVFSTRQSRNSRPRLAHSRNAHESSAFQIHIEAKKFASIYRQSYVLRGLDLNQRPSGYEPDELPLLYPAICFYITTDLSNTQIDVLSRTLYFRQKIKLIEHSTVSSDHFSCFVFRNHKLCTIVGNTVSHLVRFPRIIKSAHVPRIDFLELVTD